MEKNGSLHSFACVCHSQLPSLLALNQSRPSKHEIDPVFYLVQRGPTPEKPQAQGKLEHVMMCVFI